MSSFSLVRSHKYGAALLAALTAMMVTHAAWADDFVAPAKRPSTVPWNSPLQAGQMTLEDVLEAHTKPKKAAKSQLSATAPLLNKKSVASSQNVMLMEGLQSAMRERGSGKPTKLKPPQMQAGLMPALQAPQLAAASASRPGPIQTKYQPGQEPKNLPEIADAQTVAPPPAAEMASASSSDVNEGTITPRATDINQTPDMLDQSANSNPSGSMDVASMMRRDSFDEQPPLPPAVEPKLQPAPETEKKTVVADAAKVSAASAGCSPHVESWTKNCGEAGYPETYVGKIVGETRTLCPAGDLQDVWTENSCTPPPGSASAAPSAPLSAPAKAETVEAIPSAAPVPPELPPAKAAEAAKSDAGIVVASAAQADAPAPSDVVVPPPATAPIPPATVAEPEEAPAVPQHMTAADQVPLAAMEPEDVPPAEVSTPLPPVIKDTPSDGSCGSANGLAAISKPADELCTSGNASVVSGDGPWRWECNGNAGGMSVSCAAPISTATSPTGASVTPVSFSYSATTTPVDGKCGVANGTGTDQAPASADLCVGGVASRVNGGGPWTWACSGINGGQAVACNAPKRTDGSCGAANGTASAEMPRSNLCTSGFASAITGEGPWNWTCSGMYGGTAATCAAEPKRDAVCGSASLSGHKEAPTENLCSVGEASSVSGDGPWSWTCGGVNKGASVNCSASTSLNGTCGTANGVAVAKIPTEELCASGKATRVSGNGPWTWNCSGIGGGDTQSCTAPIAKNDAVAGAGGKSSISCGAAAETASTIAPDKDLCIGGSPSDVAGKGPWTWSCSDDSGHSASCSTLAAADGLCGTASNVASAETPEENLCAAGTAGKVKSEKGNWVWNCAGIFTGASVSCSAPHIKAAPAQAMASATPAPMVEANGAACGAAAGHGSLSAPSTELCAVGKATIVRGKGPWNWKCIKGKEKAACESVKQVDALCGAANGSMQKSAPATGLCAAGAATEIAGRGPWLWSCVGSGGGVSVSCSAASQAQARIDGSCGAASNAPATTVPMANLCDSGAPSNVYGEGPWTWTCSGFNGGIASSCSARRVIPAAPAPPGQPVNGLCGGANGVAAVVQPMEGLCSAGTATAVSGEGPWNWNCLGANGGMTVSCTAPLVPPAPITGACGTASGMPTLTTPKSGLCSAGIASAVNGRGPWTWSCSGTNGGGAVGCVAPLATSGGGPLPSVTQAPVSTASEAPAPHAAPSGSVSPGLVTPRLPSGPLPPLETTGSMPPVPGTKPFPPPPHGTSAPTMAAAEVSPGVDAPANPPDMPVDANPLQPPPVRDTIQPSPSLKPPSIDAEGKAIPGNRFTLEEDMSTLPFSHGSENIGGDALPTLDKLVGAMQSHGDVRVTLTAYAAMDDKASPRDARRLSLARALVVRDYLTSKGISSGRIDVRALGANVPSGDPDRVDVKAN